MTIYTVHEPGIPGAALAERAESVVFVPEGFSWLAAVFPIPWMIVYRMWRELAAFIALSLLVSFAASALFGNAQAVMIFDAALALIFGLEAQNLRRWWLDRSGFRLVAVVGGRTREEAERKFFSSWLAGDKEDSSQTSAPQRAVGSNPVPSPKNTNPRSEGIIGMFPDIGKAT